MRNKRKAIMIILCTAVLLLLPLQAAADPPGFHADQGTVYPGDFSALVKSGYSSAIWTYVSVNEDYGDFKVHGHSALGSYYIDYVVVIKVKPQDTGLTNIELKVESEFKYGISAGFLSTASWWLQYVVMNMGQNPPLAIGWSSYSLSDSVSWGTKNYQTKSTSSSWKRIYDTLFYQDYEEIDPNDWNYVGVWIRCSLSNVADFYRYASHSGNAWYNPTKIHFRFF
ncbi:MAG: hypothetical protein ACXAEN_22140 [Candidatus Thorarchaeota archaeon]